MTIQQKNGEKFQMIITQENLKQFTDTLVVGSIRANNYNQECFGMMELQRADALSYVVEQFIDYVEKAGYCPWKILNPLFDKRGRWIKESSIRKDLKQEVDADFRIDMSKWKQAIVYSQHVYEETVSAINEGFYLAKPRTCLEG